jgi:hypothetical protein
MGSHPVNLAFRFLLELLALGAVGYWGWTQHDGIGRWLWAISLPVVVALLWGTFAVPDDPSRSGQAPIPTPGAVRLLLELSVFAVGVVALIASQRVTAGIVLAAMVILHYAVSYDRIIWLVKR